MVYASSADVVASYSTRRIRRGSERSEFSTRICAVRIRAITPSASIRRRISGSVKYDGTRNAFAFRNRTASRCRAFGTGWKRGPVPYRSCVSAPPTIAATWPM